MNCVFWTEHVTEWIQRKVSVGVWCSTETLRHCAGWFVGLVEPCWCSASYNRWICVQDFQCQSDGGWDTVLQPKGFKMSQIWQTKPNLYLLLFLWLPFLFQRMTEKSSCWSELSVDGVITSLTLPSLCSVFSSALHHSSQSLLLPVQT